MIRTSQRINSQLTSADIQDTNCPGVAKRDDSPSR